MNQRPGKNKCPHSSVEPKKISEITTELHCVSCGEVIGYWIVQEVFDESDYRPKIEGKVPELTEEEKKELA